MSANKEQADLASYSAHRLREIFSKPELTDDDRVYLQTFCSLAVELIKSASPYRLREAGRNVEIRNLTKGLK